MEEGCETQKEEARDGMHEPDKPITQEERMGPKVQDLGSEQ